jgi:type III secretion protein Q
VSRPLALPRLTSSETQALAALTTQGSGLPITVSQGRQALLSLTPLPPAEVPLHATDSHRLRLEWGGGQMALDVSGSTLDTWVQQVLAVDTLVQLPESFRQAAIEHIVQWLTAGMEQTGRGQVVLTGTGPVTEARPSDAPHALTLTMRMAEGPGLTCLLHMDSLALMLLGSLAQSAPTDNDPQALEDLPVTLSLCVGETFLPLADMSQLLVGGLVFLSQSHMQDGQGFQLSTSLGPKRYWRASARQQDDQIILTANPIIMSTIETTSDNSDSPISWEDMPVHLTFDVGQKTLTLKQLRQLAEGQALALDREIQSAVNIRANGATIGQGQLVDIDGRLGVLLNQLHSPTTDKAE